MLVEESREVVLVLDDYQRLVAASRRAREAFPALAAGDRLPEALLRGDDGRTPFLVPYEVDGRTETLVYLAAPGELAAYEELRAGFTAAVSHELRTPLARLAALLESVALPGSDARALAARAREEVDGIAQLIDEVLFLSELESGREVVSLGRSRGREVIDEVAAALAERAGRADVAIATEGDPALELPLRRRMLHVIVENLAENALRYAGPRATLALSIAREGNAVVLTAADDGVGVEERDLPRLFERFYRPDRSRASRGTGLGLAIVKHIVTAAGGTVEATGGPGRGLQIRCAFPG